MKYAVVGQSHRINRVSDEEPQHVAPNATVVQITNQQAKLVEDGHKDVPHKVYFYVDGEFLTAEEKMEQAKQARLAQRVASMTTGEKLHAAEKHVAKHFSSFGLLEGLKKLSSAQVTNSLASIPKTVAVATWVEAVKGMALAGDLNFPEPPYTQEEVVTE